MRAPALRGRARRTGGIRSRNAGTGICAVVRHSGKPARTPVTREAGETANPSETLPPFPRLFETRRDRIVNRLVARAPNPDANLALSITGELAVSGIRWDDGDDVFWRVGDNTADTTLLNATATWTASEAVRVRLIYEAGYPWNSTGSATQNDDIVAARGVQNRRAQVVIDYDRFGTLYVGKGSNATDNLTQNDLSGTESLMHSNIADIGGGFQMRRSDGTLSDATIGNIFDNFDGDRESRLRYDSPEWNRLTASLSRDAAGRNEVTLRYRRGEGRTTRRNGADFELGAGVSVARTEVLLLGSATQTVAKLGPGAVEAVLAGGYRWARAGAPAPDTATVGAPRDAGYLYAKLGWRGDLVALGETALSVDGRLGGGSFDRVSSSNTLGVQLAQALGTDAAHLLAGVRLHDVGGPADLRQSSVVELGTILRF